MSTHSPSDEFRPDTGTALPPGAPASGAGHSVLSPADIEMDERIAAYLSSHEDTIEQAESMLRQGQAMLDEQGVDPETILSQLSPEERDKLDEMNAKDAAESEAAAAQALAAQSFAVPARKTSASRPLRRGQQFI